ncbi:glycosyltransferase family 4 protein [Myxococcota bacterium]|nr:glycosyltransferase family 4 protein [Myxococcota bacterium]
MPRIRILHVLDKLTVGDSQLHGVTRLCGWWLPSFSEEEFEIAAVSLRTQDSAGIFLEQSGVSMHYLGMSSTDPRALLALIALARRLDSDLLHLHGYGASNFGRITARMLGVPCIVHEHIANDRVPRVQQVADRLLSRLTTHGIAISQATKRFMVDQRYMDEERMEVVYNGIPLDAFADGGSRDVLDLHDGWRQQNRIPPHHRVVAIVGRLNEIKGHRYFLEAAGAVLSQTRDTSFIVVGDGEDASPLIEMTESLGIGDRVHFLGHREDVAAILQDSDICVIPSLEEGGPLVLFEAWAARCAVLITTTCGLAEMVDDGQNGFRLPPRDSEAIAIRLLELLGDPALAKRLAERGREMAFAHDVSQTVARMARTYRKLVA